MENVTGVDTPYYWNGCYTLIYGNMDLTINLIGNNSWQRSTSSGNGSTGIELLDNDLTITGDGTLSFDLYSDRWSVYSISCIKLTMNGGTLIGRSQRGINGGVAFDIYDLEMNGGSIIASAGYQAIAYVIRDGDLVFSEDYGPLIEASYKMDGSDSSVITTNEMLAVGYANWSDYQNNPAYKYIKISNDQTLYNVTASDDGHGTCTASPDSAMIGSTVTVDATPDEGYRFVEWTVISGGVTLEEPSDSTTTFELRNSDAEVCAAFEVIPHYNVNVTTDGHGTASVSDTNPASGSEVTLTATPDYGYYLAYWSIVSGDASVSGDSLTIGDSDVEVMAVFEEFPRYNVILTDDGNGTVSASETTPYEGTEITLTATPNEGYQFREWIVISGGITITDNRFTMIDNDVEIMAIFVEAPSQGGGNTTPSDNPGGTTPSDDPGNSSSGNSGSSSNSGNGTSTNPTVAPAIPTDVPINVTTEPGVAGFVERLYTVALGRSSDPVGKQDWIDAITLRGETGASAARGFLYSPEFLNKECTNEEFVTVLYSTFFDRTPDNLGFTAWINVLESGTSKEEVIEGFINSTEWANLCLRYGIRSGGTGTPNIEVEPNAQTIEFATRLYTTCLGRDADEAGMMAWARQLANQRDTGTGAARGFFFSGEFIGQDVSNAEFVNRLYRTFMGREADEAGFSAWVAQLDGGVSREEVFNGFAESPEFTRICASYGIVR